VCAPSMLPFLFFLIIIVAGLDSDNNVTHHWVFRNDQTSHQWGYCHMSTVEKFPPSSSLVVAFQASKGTEGADEQAILLKVSNDSGKTWAPHSVAVKNGFKQAVWGPALHFNAASSEMVLFFSASVPENRRETGRSYPGGDIYVTRSTDLKSWSTPELLLRFADPIRGNISKVTANKPAISPDGRTWLLPFWQEGHTAQDTGPNCAGVLVSNDAGVTWKPSPACLASKEAGWLIENTLMYTDQGDVLQLFRTKAGKIWQSRNKGDGQEWTQPNATVLPNPDSKTFLTGQKGSLVLAYNPSSSARDPIALATSTDSGHTWNKDFATLDSGGVKSFAYPTSLIFNGQIFTTYSASVSVGIELAIVGAPASP